MFNFELMSLCETAVANYEIDSHYFVDEALKITGVLDALGEIGRTDRYETMVKLSMIDLEEEYADAFNNVNELYEAMQSISEERLAEIPLLASYLS